MWFWQETYIGNAGFETRAAPTWGYQECVISHTTLVMESCNTPHVEIWLFTIVPHPLYYMFRPIGLALSLQHMNSLIWKLPCHDRYSNLRYAEGKALCTFGHLWSNDEISEGVVNSRAREEEGVLATHLPPLRWNWERLYLFYPTWQRQSRVTLPHLLTCKLHNILTTHNVGPVLGNKGWTRVFYIGLVPLLVNFQVSIYSRAPTTCLFFVY